jgi:hypothetical protein
MFHQTSCHPPTYQPTAVRTAVAHPTRHWPAAVSTASDITSIKPIKLSAKAFAFEYLSFQICKRKKQVVTVTQYYDFEK